MLLTLVRRENGWRNSNIHYTKAFTIAAAAAALLTAACNSAEPARESAREESAREEFARAADIAAAEFQRKRIDDTAQMEKRVVDLERQWTEMERQIREEVGSTDSRIEGRGAGDIKNVHGAVADLKTTSPDNWWERHDRAMERTAGDIDADVRRFARAVAPSATSRDRKRHRTPSRSSYAETSSSSDCAL